MLSLAVHSGQLYAGTRHGDWVHDGHPDGPLGGEVWRSNDGADWNNSICRWFWRRRSTPREDGVAFFQAMFGPGALYAGTYNRITGAQLWRCLGPLRDGRTTGARW